VPAPRDRLLQREIQGWHLGLRGRAEEAISMVEQAAAPVIRASRPRIV